MNNAALKLDEIRHLLSAAISSADTAFEHAAELGVKREIAKMLHAEAQKKLLQALEGMDVLIEAHESPKEPS